MSIRWLVLGTYIWRVVNTSAFNLRQLCVYIFVLNNSSFILILRKLVEIVVLVIHDIEIVVWLVVQSVTYFFLLFDHCFPKWLMRHIRGSLIHYFRSRRSEPSTLASDIARRWWESTLSYIGLFYHFSGSCCISFRVFSRVSTLACKYRQSFTLSWRKNRTRQHFSSRGMTERRLTLFS